MPYTTNFGLGASSSITGSYSYLDALGWDAFGGAEGTGNYVVLGEGKESDLKLLKTGPTGINYFGLWISSVDDWNQIAFYFQGSLILTWTADSLIPLLGGSPDYYGNPTYDIPTTTTQAFVFVNFFFNDVQFDEIQFTELVGNGGKFESDNHSVGYIQTQSDTQISSTTTRTPTTSTATTTTLKITSTTPTTTTTATTTASTTTTTGTTTSTLHLQIGITAGAAITGVVVIGGGAFAAYLIAARQLRHKTKPDRTGSPGDEFL